MDDLTSMLVPLSGTFPGWPAAETPSVTQTLLVVIGIPVLVAALIAVLVFARQLARQGRGEQVQLREPLWLGEQAPALAPARAARELTAGSGNDAETGGASVRW